MRRVFELYARGRGLTTICKTLNEARAPCPQAQRGRPRGWSPSSLRAVLLRELYRGEIVWNKTKKRDRWGAVRQTRRPARDRISVPAPQLRIVPDELWSAVQDRFESTKRRALRTGDGRLLGRPPGEGVKHLLAGLLTCLCGASFEARSRTHGRRRVSFYGCSAYHRKGTSVCANNLSVPAHVLEEAVLRSVEETILDPDIVQAAIERAVLRLVGDDGGKARRSQLAQDIAKLGVELERLVAAIATGADSKALAVAVGAREQRRNDLRASLDALESGKWTRDETSCEVRRELEARIKEWRGLLRRHPAQGQQILKKLIDGRLLMTPQLTQTESYYEFEGTGTLAGLLAGVVPHKWASPTGFEPVS